MKLSQPELVAIVSHDLRTTLNSALMVLEAFDKGLYGEISEKGKHRIASLQREMNRAIAVINQLLDLEKLESGQLALKIEDVSLHMIIDSALSSVNVLALGQDVTIDYEKVQVRVKADANRTAQVLVNLLSNAIKFSRKGDVVKISVEELADAVEISVIDNGPGIAEGERESVFDRFAQLDTEKGRLKRGLGLAICKMIVEEHHGRIGVASANGSGSRFYFTLPRAQR